jgi:hypothetical protein
MSLDPVSTWGRARASPLLRSSARQRLTLAALTHKPRARLPVAHPLRHAAAKTQTDDQATELSASPRASVPADSLSHLNSDSGITLDSFRSTNALMPRLSPCGLLGELAVSRAVPRPYTGIG